MARTTCTLAVAATLAATSLCYAGDEDKSAEASNIRRQYEAAWKYADETTMTSCKCIPKT